MEPPLLTNSALLRPVTDATNVALAEEVILETPRCILRRLNPLNPFDVAFIQQLVGSEGWSQNIAAMPEVSATPEGARTYIENRPLRMYQTYGVGMLLAVLKKPSAREGTPNPCVDDGDGQRRVGSCGLFYREQFGALYDLGFAMLPSYLRQGLAFELCQEVLRWAKRTLQLSKVAAVTRAVNEPSLGLLRKLGFREREDSPQLWYGEECGPQALLEMDLLTWEC